MFTITDRSAGYPVLADVYNDMSKERVGVDLLRLGQDLGNILVG